jgi:hypothetical protein
MRKRDLLTVAVMDVLVTPLWCAAAMKWSELTKTPTRLRDRA